MCSTKNSIANLAQEFRIVRKSVEDEERSRRPVTTDQINVDQVRGMVEKHKRIKFWEIAGRKRISALKNFTIRVPVKSLLEI